ncbi:MAG: glycine--tRNA ligase subunit beta, partial [Gammaproteobacteria bacterium]
MATHDLLIEIGTEELPPKALRKLADHFFAECMQGLVTARLIDNTDSGKLYFSPRRLALVAGNILSEQPDQSVERFGPAVNIAFTENGEPGKAAQGFAKSCGTTVDRLEQKDGKLFFASIAEGKTAAVLIPGIVNEALTRLPIPKRMRWGDSSAEFVRPVHWVIMLLGKDVIDCDILGVKTGHESRGHRYHHPDQITIESAGKYVSQLREAHVWLNDSQGSLNQAISEQVQSLAKSVDGIALNSAADSELVAEIAALVEWPVPVLGNFDPKFLALPEEVLIATLEGQQRYFPLRGPDSGELLPHFITVANIESREPERIRAGNERVIVPRLTDAMFFWDKDRAQSLASRVTLLDDMTFQKQLGSLGDKQRRVAQLAEHIATAIGSDPEQARRAAEISKCDLLTDLVGEFPELQGTIGRYIARHDGEPEDVAAAIESHYLPRFAGDRVADTKTGQALAIADRLDT